MFAGYMLTSATLPFSVDLAILGVRTVFNLSNRLSKALIIILCHLAKNSSRSPLFQKLAKAFLLCKST